jgi:hypothetical protein
MGVFKRRDQKSTRAIHNGAEIIHLLMCGHDNSRLAIHSAIGRKIIYKKFHIYFSIHTFETL